MNFLVKYIHIKIKQNFSSFVNRQKYKPTTSEQPKSLEKKKANKRQFESKPDIFGLFDF